MNIEEVKKIQRHLICSVLERAQDKGRIKEIPKLMYDSAQQICRLFQKPKMQTLEPPPRFDRVFEEGLKNMDNDEPKPDESRLLTGEEETEYRRSIGRRNYTWCVQCPEWYKEVLKEAQDAKTASIYQRKIEEILGEVDSHTIPKDIYPFVDGLVIIGKLEMQALRGKCRIYDK